jgi:hypothetical protein
MNHHWMRAVMLLEVAVGACAHDDYAQPEERSPAAAIEQVAGGEVRVASVGMTDLQLTAAGACLPALHVRLVVRPQNAADTWFLDARQIEVQIPGEGRSPPVYVNADVGGLPLMYIGPGEERVIDLFFPVPAGMSEAALAEFELSWRLTVGRDLAGGRTRFARDLPAELDPNDAPGAGAFWWFDPFYPRVGVYRHQQPFVAIPLGPTKVRVVRGKGAIYTPQSLSTR